MNFTGGQLVQPYVTFEAAFAITALTRSADKMGWQTGRLICNGGQLILFLIMLIAPGIDMSFRFKGLFILLLLRIVIAFIGMIIVRNKEDKRKHPVLIILSGLLSAALISGSMILSERCFSLLLSRSFSLASGWALKVWLPKIFP